MLKCLTSVRRSGLLHPLVLSTPKEVSSCLALLNLSTIIKGIKEEWREGIKEVSQLRTKDGRKSGVKREGGGEMLKIDLRVEETWKHAGA